MQVGGSDPAQGMYFVQLILASPNTRLEQASDPELLALLKEGPDRLQIRNLGELYTWGDRPPVTNLTDAIELAAGPRGKRGDFVGSLRRFLVVDAP